MTITPQIQKTVFDMLNEAAESGRPCPGNKEICKAIGVKSISSAAKVVGNLEFMGLIDVERFRRSRRVTIAATGKATSLPDHHIAPSVLPMPKSRHRNFARFFGSRQHCQWLEGEPSEHNLCAAPVKPGSTYCPHHHQRCYTKVLKTA